MPTVHLLEWSESGTLATPKAGKDVDQQELSFTWESKIGPLPRKWARQFLTKLYTSLTETSQDLGSFHGVLVPGQRSPWAKKAQRTKSNCMYLQLGQIMANRTQKGRNPMATSEMPEAKAAHRAWSPHTVPPRGVGRPPKSPVHPGPPISPHPHSI